MDPGWMGRWVQVRWGGGLRVDGEVNLGWMGWSVQARWGGGLRVDGEVGSG